MAWTRLRKYRGVNDDHIGGSFSVGESHFAWLTVTETTKVILVKTSIILGQKPTLNQYGSSPSHQKHWDKKCQARFGGSNMFQRTKSEEYTTVSCFEQD